MYRNMDVAKAVVELCTDQINQDDVVKARPDIDDKVTSLVSKGRWNVPGYKVCGCRRVSLKFLLTLDRRNSASCRCYRRMNTVQREYLTTWKGRSYCTKIAQ